LAIIGGTGVYALGEATPAETLATPYGEATVFRARVGEATVIFLPRHGVGHAVPPHRVNYRANVWALHALGVREVLATQAVGSLNPAMAPGDFVLQEQFIDWTKGRAGTFFDGDGMPVMHVDVTEPYCPRVTGAARRAGAFLGNQLHVAGVYACTEGPRFETAAEIRALRVLGADLVGMTSVPEVVLAREAGLCYAAVAIVCNWGAGMTDAPLTQDEVVSLMRDRAADLRRLVDAWVVGPHDGACACAALGFGAALPTGQGDGITR
jgi:5'-methylthioadenosine phosphorylase